jgi:hypothetical protein
VEYSPKDIFNVDECGLFYDMPPDKTYKQRKKGEYKKRLIILVCVNLDGTNEFSLLVRGLSKQPHYLKNMKFLPSTYSSTVARMTYEIFHELWLSLDRRMASKKRKILSSPNRCRELKNEQVVSHSCEHDISFATDASGYHQCLETEVS